MTAAEDLVSYSAAAELVGVPETTVRQWRSRHTLTPAAVVSGRPLFRPDDVRAAEEATRKLGRHRTVTPPEPPAPGEGRRWDPVVYYIRFGDRVKIGTTGNLEARLLNIPHDEVLATEPGSYDLEKRRHVQLRASRIYANREWFYLTAEVLEHIASLTRA